MNPSGIDGSQSVVRPSSAPPRPTHLQRYGLAVLSVGAALGAALLLQHFHFRDTSLPLLLLVVAIISWYGGPGPAVLAVVLSLMGLNYFFVPPLHTILYVEAAEPPGFHHLCLIRCPHHVVRQDSAARRRRSSPDSG